MNVEVAIGVFEGKVIARWHGPIEEIIFDPANAYQIGVALAQAAMQAHRGVSEAWDKEFIAGELREVGVKISDFKRDALIGQVATILKTFMRQNKSSGYIAMHCVDTVLRETAR